MQQKQVYTSKVYGTLLAYTKSWLIVSFLPFREDIYIFPNLYLYTGYVRKKFRLFYPSIISFVISSISSRTG